MSGSSCHLIIKFVATEEREGVGEVVVVEWETHTHTHTHKEREREREGGEREVER
jgi:hypothetical protein